MSLPGSAFAACPDVTNSAGYVRIGAGGSNNGTNWTNAFTSIPASPARGCTYYLAGGSYGGYSLSTSNSGTTLITLKHATIASHGIATGWLDSFAGQAVFTGIERVTDHWVIDGAVGGGPGDYACTTCGIKIQMVVSGGQDHAFGDSGSTTITDITLAHVDIQGRGRAYTGGDTDLVYFVNDAYNGFTVDHCYMHDTDRTMFLTWPSAGTGMTIQYSYIAKNGAAEHREAWSFSSDSNVVIRYNLFEEIFGTGVLAAVNNAGTASNWQVYGNVFYWTGAYSDVNGTGIINTGIIVVAASNCPSLQCIHTSGWIVTNNVVANLVSGSFLSAFDFESITGSIVCENNIWYSNNASSGPGPSGCGFSSAGSATADYNWFFGNTPSNGTSGAHDTVGSGNPFNTGANSNFPNGNWTLAASIAGTSQTAYSADALGDAFAPNWDRGAYAFVSGGSTANLSDSLSTSAVLSVQKSLHVTVSQVLATSDALSKATQAIFSESLSTSDGLAVMKSLHRAMSDSFSTATSLDSNSTGGRSVSLGDDLSTSDQLSWRLSLSRLFSESLTTHDSLGVQFQSLSFTFNFGPKIFLLGSYGLASAGACGFDLQITGEGFKTSAVARWNGSARPTVVHNSRWLTATLQDLDLATPGTAQVAIANAVNQISQPRYFWVLPNTPTISAVRFSRPSLIIDGYNFSLNTAAFWNGSALATKWISSNRLQALPPQGTRAIGTNAVTVANTGCGF